MNLPTTPDPRDAETAREIVGPPLHPFGECSHLFRGMCRSCLMFAEIQQALSSTRRQVEADAAVLREALEKLSTRIFVGYNSNLIQLELDGVPMFRPVEQANRDILSALFTDLLNAKAALSSSTAGADYLKRLSDAERKAELLQWVLKECDVTHWWSKPKDHDSPSIDLRSIEAVETTMQKEME